MALQNKYGELITAATNAGVTNLQVREQNNVLYIDGKAPSAAVKKQLWDIYNKIDPDYRAGDLILNIQSDESVQEYEVQTGDNLTKIGKRYGVSWQEIYDANKDLIKNPDLIQPGWKLKIPSAQ
jgi:nucleoid-associated protein YgaU